MYIRIIDKKYIIRKICNKLLFSDIRDQIQRTVHVRGINPQTTNVSDVLEHFQDHAGEVKYVTLAGEGDFVEECDAYVEFGTIYGVIGALKMSELSLKEKEFTVSFATFFFILRNLFYQSGLDSICYDTLHPPFLTFLFF